nr:PREDICTED: uncharacterized protein LOC109448106 [Rhinolophus sinicus]
MQDLTLKAKWEAGAAEGKLMVDLAVRARPQTAAQAQRLITLEHRRGECSAAVKRSRLTFLLSSSPLQIFPSLWSGAFRLEKPPTSGPDRWTLVCCSCGSVLLSYTNSGGPCCASSTRRAIRLLRAVDLAGLVVLVRRATAPRRRHSTEGPRRQSEVSTSPFLPAESQLPDLAPRRVQGRRKGPTPRLACPRQPRRLRRASQLTCGRARGGCEPTGQAGKAAARPEAGRRAEPEKVLRARVWPLSAVEEAGAQAGLAKCGAALQFKPRSLFCAIRARMSAGRDWRGSGLEARSWRLQTPRALCRRTQPPRPRSSPPFRSGSLCFCPSCLHASLSPSLSLSLSPLFSIVSAPRKSWSWSFDLRLNS